MSDEQKRSLFVAVVTFLLAIASIFGYDYGVIQPREGSLITSLGFEAPRAGGYSMVQNLEVLKLMKVDGAATFAGAGTFAGALTANGAADLNGAVTGPAEGNVVFSTRHAATVAEINAGHTLVTVPAALAFRLVGIKAVAYGGACGAVTSVDVKASAVILASYAQANLTQSNLLDLKTTGTTLLADGASFTSQPVGVDITVIKNGSDTTTCTGIIFDIDYVLE